MNKWLMMLSSSSLVVSSLCWAAPIKVAVAANFYKPLQALVKDYEHAGGDKVELNVGSTGQLYAQIVNGAPFDLFLAADQKRPNHLVEQHLASAVSQFTYAQGRLIFWSKKAHLFDNGQAFLTQGKFAKLALANPKTAPYGTAAVAVMKKLKIYQNLKNKMVYGQNIGQTYSYVKYGNVTQGFVALSQVYRNGHLTSGTGWIIPARYYNSIQQDAVLLKNSQHVGAAKKFMVYLKSPAAEKIIRSFGYNVSH